MAGSLLLSFLIGVYLIVGGSHKDIKTSDYSQESELSQIGSNLSVWSVYWDLEDAEEEVQLMSDTIENMSYFAAYFNSQNELIMPEATTEFFQRIRERFNNNKWTHYITIVNDKISAEGSSMLKDTELLYQLFSSQEAMDKHIRDILELAIKQGYDGIEIDYEAIRGDLELWHLFIEFCNKLYQEADAKGLKLRVLLEAQTPFDQLTLPLGPEYVMMCYNLYGMHSGPGPKANPAFIRELINKMNVLSGKKNLAIATGGFDWSSDGTIRALTEIQAYSLQIEYGAKGVRDTESQCLVYEYEDLDKNRHQVWYADAVTLNSWTEVIQKAGDYGISIWRLGGNRRENKMSTR